MRKIGAPDYLLEEFDQLFMKGADQIIEFLTYNQHPVTAESHAEICAIYSDAHNDPELTENERGDFSPQALWDELVEERDEAVEMLKKMFSCTGSP